jgi:hypothetical protein
VCRSLPQAWNVGRHVPCVEGEAFRDDGVGCQAAEGAGGRLDAHAMFTAKLGHRHTAFCLTQDRDDLGFAISRHLRLNLLVHLAEKILLPQPLTFGEVTIRALEIHKTIGHTPSHISKNSSPQRSPIMRSLLPLPEPPDRRVGGDVAEWSKAHPC